MKKIFYSLIVFSVLSINVNAQDEGREELHANASLCGGVERWAVKVLADSDAGNVNIIPDSTTIDFLVHVVTPAATPDSTRHPGIEFQTFKVWCKVTIKKDESDYDYHLVLSDGINTLIAESPDPMCATAAASAYVNQYIAVRNWIDANIAQGNVNNVNLPYVEVTGVAFIDPPHGQTGAAPNNIELHPMLEIKFSSYDGINENEFKLLSVTFSPNPFADEIKVNVISKITVLKNCSLQLFNVDAKKVVEYTLPVTGQNEISTMIHSTVAPGTYIYRIMNDGKLLYDGKLVAN